MNEWGNSGTGTGDQGLGPHIPAPQNGPLVQAGEGED